MNDLDKLLSQPLAAVADDGFSARVTRRVRVERLRGHWKTAAAVAVCVVLTVLVLPLHSIGAALGAGLPQIAASWAITLAAGIVVLSLLAAQHLSRE